jgi:cytochrome c oxidase assembly factor CtaG
MSVVAAISSVTGVRTKGLRAPFVVSTGAALAGSICLFLVDSRTSVWIIATAVMFFGYIGAIAAASLLALMYGQHATDHGLHSLAAVMGVLSAFLFVATLFDRTIPRVASAAVPESAHHRNPLTERKNHAYYKTRYHRGLGRD